MFSFRSPVSSKQSVTLKGLVLAEVYFSQINFCLDLFLQIQILPHFTSIYFQNRQLCYYLLMSDVLRREEKQIIAKFFIL